MKFKKDNGASLTGFVITILVILLIVAVAGCVYLINNPIKEKVAKQNPTGAQSNLGSIETNVENKKEPITNNETKVEIVKEKMTSDEKYSAWVQNVEKEINKANLDALYQDIKLENGNFINVGLTSKGILYLTREEQGSREFDTNVISFEICDVGNGGYKAAYYIKKDGTVSFVVLDEYDENDGEVKPILVKDAKNIVSIINNTYTDEPSSAAEVWLIDIDGNVYK